MPYSLQPPAVGEWYQAPPDAPFEIVAVDAESESIEVQYFDGTLEEFDFDAWTSLALVKAAEPEDVSGALDVKGDDYDADDAWRPAWHNPLDDLDALD